MILLVAATALAQDPVGARAAYARFPEDYAAAVGWAEAAWWSGDADASLTAWRRALALSGGNHEVWTGIVAPAVAVGAWSDAADATNRLIDVDATDPRAWVLRAWAWRFRPLALDLGRLRAAAAYRTAIRLDDTHADGWCGLGWLRLETGDRLGARRALGRTDERCPDADVDRVTIGVGGALWAGVTGWTAHPTRRSGGSGTAQAWATVDALVTLRATGRVVTVDTLGGPVNQQEGWAEATVAHAGHGATLLGAGVSGNLAGGRLIGARLWASHGATVFGEGGAASWDDGDQLQAAGGVAIPLGPRLTLEGGAQVTRLSLVDGTVLTGVAAPIAATWRPDPRLALTATARPGSEWRPIRLREPSVWNLAEPLLGSGAGTVTWTPAGGMAVWAGYEGAALGGAQDSILGVPVSAPSTVHLVTLGVTARTRTSREEP